MLYFAYGSNLDWERMKKRCPSAKFVCRATLKDYQLAFTRESKDSGWVADIVPKPNKTVWGVVYEINELDIGALDKCEGFKPQRKPEENAYYRAEFHVYDEDDTEKPLLASVYIVQKKEGSRRPDSEYKDLIVNGAKFWHLPDKYVQELEKIEIEKHDE
jgi:gamma-glutamylcyclotransferase (GGCT)/AIG2-like uncharacterized protein YtfP